MKTVLTGTMALALSAGAAMAADLPSRVAPPVFTAPAALPYSWTGFEAGLHSAYTLGSEYHVHTAGIGTPAGDIRPSYVTTERDKTAQVGAGIGYNYQFTPGSGFVVGVHADADWVDQRKDTFIFETGNSVSDYHQRLSWLGTVNGRLGYAFGRLLVYGIGGFAYGDPGVGANFLRSSVVSYTGGNNGSLVGGYDFGGGFAYALPDGGIFDKFAIEKMLGLEKLIGFQLHTTIKVEYLHYNLGTQNVLLHSTGVPGSAGAYALHYRTEGDQIRAGLVYSFGGPAIPPPVVARY